jgi:pyruvate formate lyase activating enzyme
MRTQLNEASTNTTGCVFNIQRFSVHDGPGIRTLVFLSGCPLRCAWCCNPESQLVGPQLAYNRNKCIGTGECGDCLTVCKEEALLPTSDQRQISVNRDRCTNCGACAAACPSLALEMLGKRVTVSEILCELEKDSCFYSRSGGGLTVSGGEPLLQPEFTLALLKAANDTGIETAVETCGHARWEDLESICEHVSCIFYDIKSLDPYKHKQFTNVSNDLILQNFVALIRRFPRLPIVVRTPVVPGFNDDPQEIAKIARFISPYSNVTYELIPYHAFGTSKYTFIGRPYDLDSIRPPTNEHMTMLRNYIAPGGTMV